MTKICDLSIRYPTQAVLLQRRVDLEVFHGLLPGSRVQHPSRGPGFVVSVDFDDERCKPYAIAFENGEMHSYSRESAVKFRFHTVQTPRNGN